MNRPGQVTATPQGRLDHGIDDAVSPARYWWLPLVTGVAWVIASIAILRCGDTAAASIAVLFGVFCFSAAASEALGGTVPSRGWRMLHSLLALLSIVVGGAVRAIGFWTAGSRNEIASAFFLRSIHHDFATLGR
jgi:drug/metabolite transporter (DMT)-like permease